MGNYYLMGTVSVYDDEKVLEMDGANGRTTVGMYLKSLNSTF